MELRTVCILAIMFDVAMIGLNVWAIFNAGVGKPVNIANVMAIGAVSMFMGSAIFTLRKETRKQ